MNDPEVGSCVAITPLHWRHITSSLSQSLSSALCWWRREGSRREVVLLGTPPGRDVEQKLHQIIPPAESAGSHWSICSPLWITVPQIEAAASPLCLSRVSSSLVVRGVKFNAHILCMWNHHLPLKEKMWSIVYFMLSAVKVNVMCSRGIWKVVFWSAFGRFIIKLGLYSHGQRFWQWHRFCFANFSFVFHRFILKNSCKHFIRFKD